MQLAECQGGTQVAGTSRDLREGWLPGSADWTHESCQRSSSPTCRGAGFPWRAGLGGSWPGIRHVSHGSQIPQGGHRHLSLTAEVTALSTGGGGARPACSRESLWPTSCPHFTEKQVQGWKGHLEYDMPKSLSAQPLNSYLGPAPLNPSPPTPASPSGPPPSRPASPSGPPPSTPASPLGPPPSIPASPLGPLHSRPAALSAPPPSRPAPLLDPPPPDLLPSWVVPPPHLLLPRVLSTLDLRLS